MSAWIASLAACLTAVLLAGLQVRCRVELDRTGRVARRLLIHQCEVTLYLESHRQMREVQRLVEGSLDVSTRTVRDAHLGIAEIPFGMLESLEATRLASRHVRRVHDHVADGVYRTVAGANRVLGRWTRSRLHRDDD